MTTSRKLTFVVAGVLAITAVVILRRPRAASPTPPAPFAATPSAATPATAPAVPAALRRESAGAPSAPRERGWPIHANVRARIERALATGDPLEWNPAITDLMSPVYERDEVIAVLTGLLHHPTWEVRTRVADLLLQLGSSAGVPVLQAALLAGADGAAISELAVATAATRLHLYRHPIDSATLMRAYQRHKMPELLRVAVMQQVPELGAMARDRWAANLQGYEATWIAAFGGLKDAEAIERYRWGLKAEPRTQLISQWALYQATGDETFLNQIIATARQTAGLEAKTETSWRLLKGEVFDLLKLVTVPRAQQALREIADQSATKTGDEDTFARSFTALFYLHRDFAFVDQRLMQFFRGEFQGSGIDRGLMMRIAAARRTPDLEAAAWRFNPGAYEREFIQQRDRPVEQWVNLSNVPVSLPRSQAKEFRP